MGKCRPEWATQVSRHSRASGLCLCPLTRAQEWLSRFHFRVVLALPWSASVVAPHSAVLRAAAVAFEAILCACRRVFSRRFCCAQRGSVVRISGAGARAVAMRCSAARRGGERRRRARRAETCPIGMKYGFGEERQKVRRSSKKMVRLDEIMNSGISAKALAHPCPLPLNDFLWAIHSSC